MLDKHDIEDIERIGSEVRCSCVPPAGLKKREVNLWKFCHLCVTTYGPGLLDEDDISDEERE
jgi:hypothetical protein